MIKLLGVLLATGTLLSHPAPVSAASVIFAGPFDNRGQCEEALTTEINRVRGFDIFGPGDRDDVNRRAHNALSCEEIDDDWYLIRTT